MEGERGWKEREGGWREIGKERERERMSITNLLQKKRQI